MKLKKLEVYGFKSFMDRTEILFDDGITAIVGPNGCGKSNVADAVRWVLGEQSVKTLRGGTMTDVIFSGTENKKSLSFCEVSLYFDNTDNSLPIEYDEVCITRKLYRSGESEYLLNKQSCRLKDITELMRLGQVGREGYSIIGQGRVEQFINLRPEDRREIFDEATGIAGIKQKKVESERKLIRTRDNLTRYLDILGEIERQIEPMKEQSATAKKYLELKEQLKYNEVNTFLYKTDYIDSEKKKLSDKITEISQELTVKSKRNEELENSYKNALNDIQKADDEIVALRDKQLELVIVREKVESANDLSNQRIKLLLEQNSTLQREINTLESDMVKAEKIIADNNIEVKNKQTKLNDINARLQDKQDKLDEANKAIELNNLAIEQARNDMGTHSKAMAELDGKIMSLQKSKEFIERALNENSTENNDSDDKINVLFAQINSHEEEIKQLSASIVDNRAKFKAQNDKILATKLKVEELGDNYNELQKKIVGVTSQRNFLTKMKESFDGFSTAVKKLLTDAKNDKNIDNRIEGVIANLIKVPKNLEIAIEATLGNAIQNVVTESVEDTKFLINHLKERRHGIVTFLPIPFVKPRILTRENSECLTMKGVLGVASELIDYDEKYLRVIQSLLGATVVVDNIDNAIEVAKKFKSAFKIVTVDGAILSTGGSISGGSYKPQIANILSYDRELEDASNSLIALNEKLEKVNENKKNLLISLANMNDLKQTLSDTVRSNELRLASLTESLNNLKANQTNEQGQSLKRLEKLSSYKEQLIDLTSELDKVTCDKATLEEQFKVVDKNIKAVVAKQDQLRENARSASDEFTAVRISEVQLVSEIATLNSAIDGAYEKIDGGKSTIQSKRQNIEDNDYIIEKSKTTIVDVSTFSTEEIDEIESKLKHFDGYKKSLNTKLSEVDGERTTAMLELQKLNSRKSAISFDLNKIDSDLLAMQEKLADEYELDYNGALAYKDVDYKANASASVIKKLRENIMALGHVNVNSIEELLTLNERFETMNKQKIDMLKTEDDLNKIIANLGEEMRVKFDEGFSKVNAYFKETFKELYGGGNASLKLIDNENGDRLSYGVDIEAEPPGKALQNINLLSGGEKALTAIAIIVAIMKLRPMPFCIFDEIESALDEVNTVRFAKYLKKFENMTQFILVTHKKSTMEMSNRIFGVTMQEKGVSKVVSVNLQAKKGTAV